MEEYYLGLDMGTNSVGWAVTTPDYKLVRKKGKDMWGIREFDEAQTAVDRRTNRIARRRRQKELVRRGFLRSYFKDEIDKVDPDFFTRLDNSKYYVEDKDDNVRYKYGIFNDKDYTDKDYYHQFKTIYHLRSELISNPAKHDIRLIYLAIANVFKHRGHFLNESIMDVENNRNTQLACDAFYEKTTDIIIDEEKDEHLMLKNVDASIIEEILSDKSISRLAKAERLRLLFEIEKKQKTEYEYIKCLCGLTADCKKLFPTLEIEEKLNICFADYGYDEKISDIVELIGDENYQIVELMKEIYDAGVLSTILKGNNYLSVSRVEEYEKHALDLKLLKQVVRENRSKEDYDYLFRSDKPGSYSAYVNSVNSNAEKKRRDMSSRNREDLYATISKMIKGVDGDAANYIREEISKEAFLPKQLTIANGVIPNQIHKRELVKILSNAEKHYPFLCEKDESGMTVSERIAAVFSFHVPYYIGPVTENSSKNGGNGWVVRRESGEVMPWNIEEKIDIPKTAELFINRMVRECSYLRGEKVLPKNSLMYESYCVLNEINNIKINGESIDVGLKQSIYNELFKKGKKVTRKQLEKFLMVKGVLESSEQLTGIDTAINNSLSSYGKFKAVFGDDIEKDTTKKMVERIIYLATIYGDAKSILKEQIVEEFGNFIPDDKLKRIMGFKFKDWGRFSQEFFCLQGCSVDTGEIISLYKALWDTNFNLMELINSDHYTFKEELIKRKNTALQDVNELKYEDLADYYFSAPVKRMIWQTLLIIKEIKEIMGGEPAKIFIEMTRGDEEKGDKGRKDSRKKKFLELYKNIKDDLHNWDELIESSDSSGKLRSKKMYLYLAQMGRDMYTGKPIDLDKLFDDSTYNIDHIYPRSVTNDNNIENNLVLVEGTLNREKSADYPLNSKIQNNPEVKNLWKMLREKGLMNSEKYARLTSRSPLTEEQLAGFIARQLVETAQATKGVADILKGVCPDSELVYSKARNVSDFRNKFGLYKCRSLNEFHHANDAYLNIVVGNAYNVKFTNNPIRFIKKEHSLDSEKYAYNLGKMFEKDIIRADRVGWIAQTDKEAGTIAIVKAVMAKNTPIMTRMVREATGALYNLQPVAHTNAKSANYVALKSSVDCMSNVERYGGYGSLKPAYFVFIEYGKEKKRKKCFDVIPMIIKAKIKDETDLKNYFEDNGYENVRVIASKIKVDSLLKLDGYFVYIAGMDSRKNIELHNAVNLSVDSKINNYVHNIEKSIQENRIHREINEKENLSLYEYITNKYCEGFFKKYPKDIGSVLKNGNSRFKELSLEKQVEVLGKILTISAISGKTTELKDIGGPSSDVGRIRISGNMTDRSEVKMINQSVTGIYEKITDLLNL